MSAIVTIEFRTPGMIGSTFVRLDQIASVDIPGGDREATVVMQNGMKHPCTNPGKVRDEWSRWLRRQETMQVLEDRSLFGRIFGPSK